MLGGRTGLYWVGGRFYAGWEDGSMLGGSCPFLFFARTNFFANPFLPHFAGLEWARSCVRECVRACMRACLRVHFLACVYVRAFYA